jgi:hypothetical protein
MVPLSKSGVRKHRGFESRPLRQLRPPRERRCVRWPRSAPRSRTSGSARSGPTPAAFASTPTRRADGRSERAARGVGASRYSCCRGRGRLVDYGAALEMRFGATRRGFESRPLRHLRTPRERRCVRWPRSAPRSRTSESARSGPTPAAFASTPTRRADGLSERRCARWTPSVLAHGRLRPLAPVLTVRLRLDAPAARWCSTAVPVPAS